MLEKTPRAEFDSLLRDLIQVSSSKLHARETDMPAREKEFREAAYYMRGYLHGTLGRLDELIDRID